MDLCKQEELLLLEIKTEDYTELRENYVDNSIEQKKTIQPVVIPRSHTQNANFIAHNAIQRTNLLITELNPIIQLCEPSMWEDCIKQEPGEKMLEHNITSSYKNKNEQLQITDNNVTLVVKERNVSDNETSLELCRGDDDDYVGNKDKKPVEYTLAYDDGNIDNMENTPIMKFEPVMIKVEGNSSINTVNYSWTGYKCLCCYCEMEFENMTKLRTHTKEAHTICYGFKCMDCGKQYNIFNTFIEHVRQHREILRYYCQYCNGRFERRSICEEHVQNHLIFKKNICMRCGEILPNAAYLDEHKRKYKHKLIVPDCEYNGTSSWEDYPWSCQDCFVHMPNMEAVRTHAQMAHSKCFVMKCMDCPEVQTNFATFVEHVRRHRPYLKKFCQFCNRRFENPKKLNNHVVKHININGQKKPCDCCGEIFQNKSLLLQHVTKYKVSQREEERTNEEDHMLLDKTIKRFKCDICGKSYSYRSALSVHVKTHHRHLLKLRIDKDFISDYCGKQYNSKLQLENHIMSLHSPWSSKYQFEMCNKTEFICDYCGLRHKQKVNLVKHITTVHEKLVKCRMFTCNICSKSFTCHSSLSRHLSSHEMNRKREFTCNVCNKSYYYLQNLRNHMRSHDVNRKKAFTCNVCSKSFYYPHHLNRHMRSHDVNRKRAFSCNLCDKTYFYAHHVRDHMRSHEVIREEHLLEKSKNSFP